MGGMLPSGEMLLLFMAFVTTDIVDILLQFYVSDGLSLLE